VKDKLKFINNSLKFKGCFFCFWNKAILAVSFTLLFLFFVSPVFSQQVLEYNSVTGLWNYSDRDFASPFSSRQVLEYNSVTGLWSYSNRDFASPFFSRQVFRQDSFTGLWH